MQSEMSSRQKYRTTARFGAKEYTINDLAVGLAYLASPRHKYHGLDMDTLGRCWHLQLAWISDFLRTWYDRPRSIVAQQGSGLIELFIDPSVAVVLKV